MFAFTLAFQQEEKKFCSASRAVTQQGSAGADRDTLRVLAELGLGWQTWRD